METVSIFTTTNATIVNRVPPEARIQTQFSGMDFPNGRNLKL
jgi:hypothetical protein